MYNRERNYPEDNLGRTKITSLLFAVIIAGVLFGTMVYCGRDNKDIFLNEALCNGFIKLTDSRSIIDVFYRAISWTSLLVILQCFLGFCAISQPVEIFILFYRGMTLGISIAYTYGIYGTKGFVVSLFMILPHALITSVVLVYSAREALRFSNIYVCYLSNNISERTEEPEIKLYFVRFAVLMIFTFLSAVIDCIVTYLLTDILLM